MKGDTSIKCGVGVIAVLALAASMGLGQSCDAADARRASPATGAQTNPAGGATGASTNAARGADSNAARSASGAGHNAADGARNVDESGQARDSGSSGSTSSASSSGGGSYRPAASRSPRTPQNSRAPKSKAPARPDNARPYAPELAEGMELDRTRATWQLEDLRGRVVLMLFFRTDDLEANTWSAELLRQLSASFAADPAVELLAISTTPAEQVDEAQTYLARRTPPDHWRVLHDTEAVFCQIVTGSAKPFGYALLNTEGQIIEIGDAAEHELVDGRRVFALAGKDLKALGKVDSQATEQITEVHATLSPSVQAAQLGDFERALRGYAEAAKNPELSGDAATLRQMILDVANRRVEQLAGQLQGTDAATRFAAYNSLQSIARRLPGSEPGNAAALLVRQAARDPIIRSGMISQNIYRTLTNAAAQETGNSHPELVQRLRDLLGKWPDSFYGYVAAEALARMGESTQ